RDPGAEPVPQDLVTFQAEIPAVGVIDKNMSAVRQTPGDEFSLVLDNIPIPFLAFLQLLFPQGQIIKIGTKFFFCCHNLLKGCVEFLVFLKEFFFDTLPFCDIDRNPEYSLLVVAKCGEWDLGGLEDMLFSGCIDIGFLRDKLGRSRCDDFTVVIEHVPEFGSVAVEPGLGFSHEIGYGRIVPFGDCPVCKEIIPIPVLCKDHMRYKIDDLLELGSVTLQRVIICPAPCNIPENSFNASDRTV